MLLIYNLQALKTHLQSKTFYPFLSKIYNENNGQIYNLHLGLKTPP